MRPSNLRVYLPAVMVSVFAGLYLARSSRPLILYAAAALAVLAVTRWKPRIAAAGALTLMALPYTWSPNIPKLGLGIGILAGLVLTLAYLDQVASFTPVPLDWAVLFFAVTPAAVAYYQTGSIHLTTWLAPAITLPYFGFRFLFHRDEAREIFPTAIIAIGTFLAAAGVYETLAGRNPFVSAATPNYGIDKVDTVWDVPLHRGGELRAMATFGHPIAFGMFLLIPLAFALSRSGRRYAAATLLILAGEIVTFSRGPWIGALVIIILMSGWSRRRVATITGLAIAAAVFVGPVHRVIVDSGSVSTEAGQNALYRVGLIRESLYYLSTFGRPTVDLQSVIPNFPDVTSLLASTIIRNGIVGVLELALIVWLCVRALLAARGRNDDRDARAATVAAIGEFAGLVTVALITSYQFFFWALLAYVASTAMRASEAAGDDVRDLTPSDYHEAGRPTASHAPAAPPLEPT